ncbi:MAG: arsenate reductase [Myxococcota bacterium]|jgi:arsenate reductase
MHRGGRVSATSITVWHYPGCSTCKKALKWLRDHDVDFQAIHIVSDPPDAATLGELHARSGLPLKRFFNTAGQSYRNGDFKTRLPNMSQDEALAALAADGKLIKRPLLASADAVLVGFKEAEYAELTQ